MSSIDCKRLNVSDYFLLFSKPSPYLLFNLDLLIGEAHYDPGLLTPFSLGDILETDVADP